jgi:hypothetical protein
MECLGFANFLAKCENVLLKLFTSIMNKRKCGPYSLILSVSHKKKKKKDCFALLFILLLHIAFKRIIMIYLILTKW